MLQGLSGPMRILSVAGNVVLLLPHRIIRRKLAELFGIDPQELFSDLNDDTSKKTIVVLPPEPEVIGDWPNETGDALQGNCKAPPAWLRRGLFLPPKIYMPVASIMVLMLTLGGVFVLPSILFKLSPDLFPALCSGNFELANTFANTTIVNTPETSTALDGDLIGLSEGANVFGLQRPNHDEVQYKLQAAQATTKDPQNVVSSLKNAINSDPTDAEAQIYLENWKVLKSNHPHITFVVGASFAYKSDGASDSALQGSIYCTKRV